MDEAHALAGALFDPEAAGGPAIARLRTAGCSRIVRLAGAENGYKLSAEEIVSAQRASAFGAT